MINGEIFTVTFNAVAVTAAQDLFELATGATSKIQVLDIEVWQTSDFGDAQAEILGIQLIRGNTTTGSGGSAATPALARPWGRTSTVTAAVNNTTVATAGTASTLISSGFNVAAGYVYRPPIDDKDGFYVDVSSRIVLRVTAPADSLTMNGTFKFKEIGKQGP